MGENSKIAWCDHTFNPWIGCTKVSPGCANCYAERQNKRYNWNPAGWGRGALRKRTSTDNWQLPIKWAKQTVKDGVTRRVFCASLADVFDPLALQEWRIDLWNLIVESSEWHGGLEWLLLTKRPENIESMLPRGWIIEPPDYVRIGVTCENQNMADLRTPELLRVWGGKNFVSYEPALGPVDFTRIKWAQIPVDPQRYASLGVPAPDSLWSVTNALQSRPGNEYNKPVIGIDWVICGCESGPGRRPCNIDWLRSVRDQCSSAGVPFFLKQMEIDGKLVSEPELDGRKWLQFPEAAQ